MQDRPTIVTLIDLTDPQIDDLVGLLRDTWPDWYGPTGNGDAAKDLADRHGRDGFPVGVAALIGGRAIGTAAMACASFGKVDAEGPWLIGLVVAPQYRKSGIGSEMIAWLEAEALRRNKHEAFATTREAAALLQRRDWAVLRDVTDEDGKIWQVLRKSITDPA